LQGSPCGLKRKEAHSEFDQPLNETMILLDKVVEVLALPSSQESGINLSAFSSLNAFG
jgi:hypothetical protein